MPSKSIAGVGWVLSFMSASPFGPNNRRTSAAGIGAKHFFFAQPRPRRGGLQIKPRIVVGGAAPDARINLQMASLGKRAFKEDYSC